MTQFVKNAKMQSDLQGQGSDRAVNAKMNNKGLDFGWFKLPPEGQERMKTPLAGEGMGVRGLPPGDPESESRPMSSQHTADASHAAPSANSTEHQQQHLPQQQPHRPPTRGGSRCLSQAGITAEEAEMAYNRINDNRYRPPEPSATYDDNIVIDWPLSGVEMAGQPQRPCSTTRKLETPMPPLQFEGYGQNSNRPTYASWRESWHRARLDNDNNNNSNDVGDC